MSYCVNCGVELAESEKFCPLCGVAVNNPRSPWKEVNSSPYPPTLELLMRRVDRRYMAVLISVFLLIPVCITILCDLLGGGGLSWSIYVLGAAVILMVWFVLPLYCNRYRRLTFLALDCLVVIGYLWAIAWNGRQGWFYPVALPIAVTVSVLQWGMAYYFRKGKGKLLLQRIALTLIAAAIVSMVVELVVDLYCMGTILFNWSPYVLIPCLILAVALQIIQRKNNFKEEIRKRLFY
ncbi:MAG: zinc ribbon domain-containing protein [Clostridiales bacterium]